MTRMGARKVGQPTFHPENQGIPAVRTMDRRGRLGITQRMDSAARMLEDLVGPE